MPSVRFVPCRTGSSSTADGPGDLISSADRTLQPIGPGASKAQPVGASEARGVTSRPRHAIPRCPAPHPPHQCFGSRTVVGVADDVGIVSYQCRNDRTAWREAGSLPPAMAGPVRSRTTAARSWTGAPCAGRRCAVRIRQAPRHCPVRPPGPRPAPHAGIPGSMAGPAHSTNVRICLRALGYLGRHRASDARRRRSSSGRRVVVPVAGLISESEPGLFRVGVA